MMQEREFWQCFIANSRSRRCTNVKEIQLEIYPTEVSGCP